MTTVLKGGANTAEAIAPDLARRQKNGEDVIDDLSKVKANLEAAIANSNFLTPGTASKLRAMDPFQSYYRMPVSATGRAELSSAITEYIDFIKTTGLSGNRGLLDDLLYVQDQLKKTADGKPFTDVQANGNAQIAMNDTARLTEVENQLRALSVRNADGSTRAPSFFTSGKFFGLTLGAVTSYILIMLIGTNGATVNITNITFNSCPASLERVAEITWDEQSVKLDSAGNPQGSPDTFNPVVGDYVKFDNDSCLNRSGSNQAGDAGLQHKIIERLAPNKIKVKMDSNALIPGGPNNVPSSCPFSPWPTACRGKMTVYTDIGNQLGGAVGDVLDTTAAVVNAAVSSGGSAVITLINLGGRALGEGLATAVTAGFGAAGTVGSAARGGFCKVLPIFCNSTIWIVLLAAIVGLIIMSAMSKKSS